MSNEQRINIGPLARQIRNEGLEMLGQRSFQWSDNLSAFYSEAKPEVYALTAVLIDGVITRAQGARVLRPPFGLIYFPYGPSAGSITLSQEDIDRDRPFNTIQMAMFGTLMDAQTEEIEGIKTGNAPTNIQQVYWRLVDIMSNYIPANAEFSLSGGIDFASVIMSGTAQIIPTLARDASPDKLIEIARNSLPIVTRFAAGNVDHNTRFLRTLVTDESWKEHYLKFRTDCFKIKDVGAATQLVLSEHGEQRLRNAGIDNLMVGNSPTIGCPALVNFGEGSAINLLWNWYVDVAREVYPLVVDGRARDL